jgi:thiol-disulfide isomerase/thioredoxin
MKWPGIGVWSVWAIALMAAPPMSAAGLEPRPALPASVLQAKDMAGQRHALTDYRGKVVLLNFWASWCPPCRREMPSMERLRLKMAGRPLEILALDSVEPVEDVQGFLATLKLGFPILLDPEGVNTRRWKVYALPTTFLLDVEGRIRFVLKGGAEWDEGEALQVIEGLLNEAQGGDGGS